MLLSLSNVDSILILKHFLGGFSLLRNYKLKSVINLIQLRILFKFFSNFLDLSVLLLGIMQLPCLQSTTMNLQE